MNISISVMIQRVERVGVMDQVQALIVKAEVRHPPPIIKVTSPQMELLVETG